MPNLIPYPYDCREKQGYFEISGDLVVKSDFDLSVFGIKTGESDNFIISQNHELDDEEYTLSVTENSVRIEAAENAGAYYALQTLRQLSRFELGGRKIPCVEIKDKPRFEWRGLQLDESRHFFGKEEVKRLLDMMFMMKLNRFHWHLTDDQGWRIEIKKYPLLTEVGSKRKYTQINGWHSWKTINQEYGGFYTQDEIREIVDYAQKRNIMIIPEIDFPAHCASAIACYPWLACRELDREVPGYFGGSIPQWKYAMWDWNRTICVGKEETMKFVFDVIGEVCDLFPAPYFHIGGDEAPKNEWKKCPKCQNVIKENNLKDEENLQGWFNNKILDFLKKKGKRLIGWNEILKAGNLDKSVIGQYWTVKRDVNAENHINSGGNLIMSNHENFYFDMPYGKYPLQNTYSFKPENYNVHSENIKNVLGVEGEGWTEWIDGREKLDLCLYPRVQCLAEVAWSAEKDINWDDFLKRLDSFKDYYRYLGINYAVDKISMPANPFTRLRINNKFMRGDTHLEVKLNKKYLAKGEK